MDKENCEITVSLGVTKNLGNFESVRYDVSLKLAGPVKDREKIYDAANTWVSNKIKDFQG